MPTEPIIVLSYGMPKSASTFVYQVTEVLGVDYAERYDMVYRYLSDIFPECAESSVSQAFAEQALRELNYPVDETGLDMMVQAVEGHMLQHGGIITIKTHLAAGPYVQQALAEGRIFATATFRHPADIILSRVDMAKRLEQEVREEGIRQNIGKTQFPALKTWTDTGKAIALSYDDIREHPYTVARKVATIFGEEAGLKRALEPLLADTSAIYEFNKGLKDRRKREMPAEVIEKIENSLPEMMAFIESYESLHKPMIFGIVVPTLNCADTVDQTILSIVSQKGDFRIRLHVQDGGSTDGTLARVSEWETVLSDLAPKSLYGRVTFTFSSETDTGVYQAVNRGFSTMQADMYTWVGADDLLLPGTLQTVSSLITAEPEVEWVTGVHSLLREDGVPFPPTSNTQDAGMRFGRSQIQVARGAADGTKLPLIQQEGTFWSHRIWQAIGAQVREDFKLAADFDLWVRLAEHAEPVLILSPLAHFRKTRGQLSSNVSAYLAEIGIAQKDARKRMAKWSPEKMAAIQRDTCKVARLDWTTGLWQLEERVVSSQPGLIKGEPPPEQIQWRLDGRETPVEAPNTSAGETKSFSWLTGREFDLAITTSEAGIFRLTFKLANPHPDQWIYFTGEAGLNRRVEIPVTSMTEEPFEINVRIEKGSEDFIMHTRLGVAQPIGEDARELGLVLFELSAIRRYS